MNWEPRLYDEVRGYSSGRIGVVVKVLPGKAYRVFWRTTRREETVTLGRITHADEPRGDMYPASYVTDLRTELGQAREDLRIVRNVRAHTDSIPAHKLDNVRAYVKGLRAWQEHHDDAVSQYATDIMYLIGEDS